MLAKIVGFFVFYLLSIIPVPFVRLYMTTIGNKLAISLLPQTTFFLGLEVFNRAEVRPLLHS